MERLKTVIYADANIKIPNKELYDKINEIVDWINKQERIKEEDEEELGNAF